MGQSGFAYRHDGMKKILLFLILLVIGVPLIWVLVHKYEGTPPAVRIDLPAIYLKKNCELVLHAEDQGTGLRQVQVSLLQQGNEKILVDRTYPSAFLLDFADKGKDHEQFTLKIETDKLGLADGKVQIRIRVADYSWRSWNQGNLYYSERPLIVDSQPPKVEILSRQHNVSKGGAGLVIFRVFEPDLKTGVQVGENFFPGYPGIFDDTDIHAAFFGLDYTQGPGTRIRVVAEDAAGNITRKGFYHYIRDKKFKTDTLNISDRFLESTMPAFSMGDSQNPESSDSLLDKFLKINGPVRKANVEHVLAAPKDTVNQILWKGRFSRLSGSAPRAGFADHRIYQYKGREIDRAVHLGVDLASTAEAPVEAANAGRIIMAQEVGIFGNTVIIDHGFGLASLYAHLSYMAVTPGDRVAKGDIIGNTGVTGLAGGDHLHFSMIVHNVFVTPLEWWDDSWIKNNITSKIVEIGTAKK